VSWRRWGICRAGWQEGCF